MKRIGLDIVQPIVPAYRVPLFTRLAARPDLDMSVQCSVRHPFGMPSVAMDIPDYFSDRRMTVLSPLRLVWQSGLRLIKARGPGDVLVICGDVHYLSNLPLIHQARRQGVGIVWWGHSWSATSRKFLMPIRMAIMRRCADVVLLYMDSGVDMFCEYGYPAYRLFSADNTIDLSPVQRARDAWSADALQAFARREDIEGRDVLLFVSELTHKTRLDLAIAALADPRLRARNSLLVVIGDGVMRATYEKAARSHGVCDRIRWMGRIHQQDRLAPWFLSARMLVYPGSIGLSIIHAFGYGLPVITHSNDWHQMPEFSILREGQNGMTFTEGSSRALADTAMRLLEAPEMRDHMSRCARETVEQRYTMDNMVEKFDAAIQAASAFSLINRPDGRTAARSTAVAY